MDTDPCLPLERDTHHISREKTWMRRKAGCAEEVHIKKNKWAEEGLTRKRGTNRREGTEPQAGRRAGSGLVLTFTWLWMWKLKVSSHSGFEQLEMVLVLSLS